MRLNEKVAVVTGAGSGLGRSIALAFAREGALVAAVDRDGDSARRTLADIEGAGGAGLALQADIAQPAEAERFMAEVSQQFGKLDILANNAGITGRSIGDGPVADCSLAAWEQIMAVNLSGTFLCCKYALQLMERQRSGVLVNVSSVLGLVGCQDHFTSHAYQASKAGIIGLTRSIAAYYARFGIRANVLAPGLIASRATAALAGNEAVMAFVRQMQPLGEWGEPEDAALAAVYLASDEARFVTGQVLAVDGGWTVQ